MKSGETIRVMLVDDHFVVRAGLAEALTLDADIEVVAECGNGEDALVAYREYQPDVVLMDWRLPGMSGVEACAAIRKEFSAARVLSLTVYEGEEDIYRAVQAGVVGYLPKTVSRKELLSAVRSVAAGGTCFPPAIEAKLEERKKRTSLNPNSEIKKASFCG